MIEINKKLATPLNNYKLVISFLWNYDMPCSMHLIIKININVRYCNFPLQIISTVLRPLKEKGDNSPPIEFPFIYPNICIEMCNQSPHSNKEREKLKSYLRFKQL